MTGTVIASAIVSWSSGDSKWKRRVICSWEILRYFFELCGINRSNNVLWSEAGVPVYAWSVTPSDPTSARDYQYAGQGSIAHSPNFTATNERSRWLQSSPS